MFSLILDILMFMVADKAGGKLYGSDMMILPDTNSQNMDEAYDQWESNQSSSREYFPGDFDSYGEF